MKAITAVLSGGKALLVLSVILLVAFGGLFYVDRGVKENSKHLAMLKINAERIQNLDTRSTNAVRLAASLRSDRYIINYQDLQDAKYELLEENLRHVQSDEVRASLTKMEEVQGDLEDAESEAIALVDEEKWEDALELVTEPAYRRQKGIYRSHLSTALREMIKQSQRQADQANIIARTMQISVLATFLILAMVGYVYSRAMKQALRRQSDLMASLADANENLEERVSARTAELEENQALLQTTLESMDQGITSFDRDLNLVAFNSRAVDLYEVPENPLRPGMSFIDFVRAVAVKGEYGAGDPEQLALSRRAAANDFTDARFERSRPDGMFLEVRRSMVPTGGFVTTYTDISERKQMELELVKAREAAEGAAEAKAEFLATMSHEIRTPMNGVMSMAEILDQTKLSSDQKSMTRTIRQSAQALLTVINDILDFSKIEAGKLEIEHIAFDMAEVIQSTADLLAPRAEESSLDLFVEFDYDIPKFLLGDPTRIRQILLNLGSNAIKFTSEGHVTFKVRETARNGEIQVRVEVMDTGIGLSDEQQGKLFQAFAQADTSTSRKFGGTGLGLSICKRLCEMMGGDIGVESAPGAGSTFWFELPFAATEQTRHAPIEDLSDARVLLVGYGALEASILERILNAGNIRSVARAFDGATREQGLDEGLAALLGPPSVVFVNGKPGLHGIRDELDGLGATLGTRAAPIVISAPHGLASTLDTRSLASANLKLLSSVTTPPRMERLWHLVAVALGKAELDQDGSVDESQVEVFRAPSLEDARRDNAVLLVAEDNETNQIVIRRILARLGFAFEIADDGAEALRMYEDRAFGMLLTDFHMPEMDGFELTAAIRQREAATADGGRLPIIALTADALPETEQQCLDAGMDGYLRKPIEMPRLEAALEANLPQALALRVIEDSDPESSGEEAEAPQDAIDELLAAVDKQVFDPDQLYDSFGPFDAMTAQFVSDFVADLDGSITDLGKALETESYPTARDIAHAMKGAAASVGAVRMGQIMSDIQDRLDDNDPDTAALFCQLLPQTLEELKVVVEPLNHRFLG